MLIKNKGRNKYEKNKIKFLTIGVSSVLAFSLFISSSTLKEHVAHNISNIFISTSDAIGDFDVLKDYSSYQGDRVYYSGIKVYRGQKYKIYGYLYYSTHSRGSYTYYGMVGRDLTVIKDVSGGGGPNIPMPYSVDYIEE